MISPVELWPLSVVGIDHLLAGRANMGVSLAFHIAFASFGVGLPLMMLIAEGISLRNGDPVWRALARRWSQAFAVLFAVGAVSGTIISFELGLLWPKFMGYAGGIIGLPFSIEGFFFFTEAIFLGLYLYGWDRLSPKLHWLSGIPIAIAGPASGFIVVTANAWMNTPEGFRIVGGQVADVDPLAAMFNRSFLASSTHMVIAAYLATAFMVAAVYAVGMLRGRRDLYHRRALTLGLAIAAVAAPIQIGIGDIMARQVAENQPPKLAAMEALWTDERGAGLNVLGLPIPGEERNILNVKVPKLLSLLAYDDPDAKVRGLKSIPKQDRPNVLWVRPSYIAMVGIGFLTLALGMWFWLAWRRRGGIPDDRWTLRAIVVAGPLTLLAIELGWIVTELGRQPWTIYGYLRTEDAVTQASGLGAFLIGFAGLYVVLATTAIWLLGRIAKGTPPELNLDSGGRTPG